MNLDTAILRALGDDDESTLLILDGIGDSHPDATEASLLEALLDLERRGLVGRREQHLDAGSPAAAGGVPELALGRRTVTWWGLTAAGRARI